MECGEKLPMPYTLYLMSATIPSVPTVFGAGRNPGMQFPIAFNL
ncbi:hypothetical protein Cal7507_2121 [Calothrix sp. PCC 7507]|nr:hypothetical protein Cal7507_2121 [Calothrix sp. PCC 7507]